MALIQDCTGCYKISLPECAETITVDAGLAVVTKYYVHLINRFGQIFEAEFTTDADGKLAIDTTLFEAGLFSHTAGVFKLVIFKNPTYNAIPETLNLCGVGHTCVAITFTRVLSITDDKLSVTIPGECPEE